MLEKKIVTIGKFSLIALSIILIIASAFSYSSYLAILGTAVIFWGALLFYITPAKHLPLKFAESLAESNNQNVERLLSDFGSTQKGIYLPPDALKSIESSLVLIPKASSVSSVQLSEATSNRAPNGEGLFITPCGFQLSQIIEKELNTSFVKLDLTHFCDNLNKVMVEQLAFAENIETNISKDIIEIKITGSIFDGICRKTESYPRMHAQIGCLLSSALACALAKVTGKPLIMKNETRNEETRITQIDFLILEGAEFTVPNVSLPDLKPAETPLPQETIEIAESKNSDVNALEVEVPPDALKYFKKSGEAVLLVSGELPQASSYQIKGYRASGEVFIDFLEFVEVCKTSESTLESGVSQIEYTTKVFDPSSPSTSKDYDLTFYLKKSGFATVTDWLDEIKVSDTIPECKTGRRKIFLIYKIHRPAPN